MNRKYQDKFGISGYARWDYDMEKATLIFSNNGIPEVCAYIQIAGSIAHQSKSWLWAWNNSSLPQHVKTTVLD
jgi:hypothetical protein